MPDPAEHDRNLLLGLLALQTGRINPAQLAAASRAWAADKARPLDEHLTDLGHLDKTQKEVLNTLADLHVAAHEGDVEKSLAAIPISEKTRAELAAILGAVAGSGAEAGLDPGATLPHGGGETTIGGDATRSLGSASSVTFEIRSSGEGGASSGEGRFRIIRAHAQGGLGAVYVALDSELHREVALKQILENHADNQAIRSRFLVEAEITGGLEHPGIVPVYGLGADGAGRPYYAMRFIRGGTLSDAIKAFHEGPKTGPERSLEFRRLLRKFTDVCNTIDYAHSRGVLHRDIKPANVVVGKHGETLVVDWGLAKALGRSAEDSGEQTLIPSSGDGSAATVAGQAIGTPAFMSPEQARGESETLDSRSDVYSLGATLFCLLTGRAPFQGSATAALAAARAGEFPRPRSLDPSIDPALEAIVLKAMAVKPEARYASAEALAGDVDRWMADERVEAHREPWTRTMLRWLTRHRTGVTAAAAAGLVALAGLGIFSAAQTTANARLAAANRELGVQRARAEANESRAIEAVKRFTSVITDNPELKDNPELDSLRKTLLKEPLSFFNQLHERLQADNDAQPESLFKLADVGLAHARLVNEIGDKEDAVRTFREAIDIFDGLVQGNPDAAEYLFGLAEASDGLVAALWELGRIDEGRTILDRVITIRKRMVRDHPEVAEYQNRLAGTLNNLSALLGDPGRSDEDQTILRRAIEIQERLVRDHPAARYQNDLAKHLKNLGSKLKNAGRLDEARTALDRAVEIWERLVRDHPDVVPYQAGQALALAGLGDLLQDAGRLDEARTALDRAVEIWERLVRDHPATVGYQGALARSLNDLGVALKQAGRLDEARTALDRAVEIGERLVRDHPAVAQFQDALAKAHATLAQARRDAGRIDEAQVDFEKAVAIGERLVRDHPEGAGYRNELTKILTELGGMLLGAGRTDEAQADLEKAVAIGERLVRDHPDVAGYRSVLAMTHIKLGYALEVAGKPDAARSAFERVVETTDRLPPADLEKPDLASAIGGALNNLAIADFRASRFAEARQRLLKAIDWQKKALAVTPSHPQYLQFLENHLKMMVKAARGLGDQDEIDRAERELAEFRIHDPRSEAAETRLQALINGAAFKDAAEQLALAWRAYSTRRFRVSVRFWGDALDADPKLADDRKTQHAYNAACAAALAANDVGIDPPNDDAEKARLRGRALDWLKAEMDRWAKLLDSDQPQAKETVAKALRLWREDPDLASVRGEESLAKLPEDERAAWKALWESVADLLAKAAPAKAS